jgi:hypothetical protein
VSAIGQDQQAGFRQSALDAVHLFEGAVFVVGALHRHHGAGDAVEVALDVP